MTRPLTYDDRNVRSTAAGLLVASVAATLALTAIVSLRPAAATAALQWYPLALGVFAIVGIYRIIAGAYPTRSRTAFDRAVDRERHVSPERPERLEALEGYVRVAQIDSAGFRMRLLPVLRATASYRLASRRRITVDTQPAAARHALTPDIYDELWGPDNDVRDRRGPGANLSQLTALLHALEEL